tara:strand:- start:2313 stop:3494 length:1182 start_codon:yes stop_codon:yes gene_type:complete
MLSLIGRSKELFIDDISTNADILSEIIKNSSFLVLGAAGSIGQSLVKELFNNNPKKLHLVDLSENNLVELVRDLRSSQGYIDGDFKTFALDIGSTEFDYYLSEVGSFDYIFNFSALKHVRSESNPFTLMRMINTNIINTLKTIKWAKKLNAKKYFCVSTDKAANPVNMMGASKRIMEMYLMQQSQTIDISTARFANVAFSDGSLLHGFEQRIKKKQPIAAPSDIKRYFVTPKEAGELCLISGLLGNNREIFFPKLSPELNLISFDKIALKFLKKNGYEPFICDSEDEARKNIKKLISDKKWPCYFFESDTTGEKDFEEFYTEDEKIDLERFKNIGIVLNNLSFNEKKLEIFLNKINAMQKKSSWNKSKIVNLFNDMIPNFSYIDKNKYLDEKM